MKRFARIGLWLLIASYGCAAMAAGPDKEPLLRNPFWPTGYSGKRYPISADPRYNLERAPAASALDANASSTGATGATVSYVMAIGDDMTNDPIWSEAVQALHFGSALSFSETDHVQAAIEINNRVYAVGDLVSVNFRSHRLTWRIESLSTEGKLTLKRLTYRKIGPNS